MLAHTMCVYRHRWVGPVVLAAGWLTVGAHAVLGAQMAAGLDRDTIYLGTQTLLNVEVADPKSNEWPAVSPVDGLQISHYGSPGVIQDLFSGSVRRSYRFLVNPSRAGIFKIPAVTVGSGADAVKQGPFTLQVIEATFKFLSAHAEPAEIQIGERATVSVTYQGVRTGKNPEIPVVNGLTLRMLSPPRVEITRPQGMPVTICQIEVKPTKNGTYQIKGISLDGVPAGPVALQVSPFVIAGSQVVDPSLVVGGQTLVHLLVRGLPASEKLRLVAPPGLKIERAKQQYQGPAGGTVFSFDVTAAEPGSPTITTLQLADGRQVPLAKPITLSVRQSGQGDILACRGSARSQQTTLGEPFIVDFEVFFRGDLQGAAIDLSQAEFANRPYIKVEPMNDLSYEGWTGQPMQVEFGEKGRAMMLSGSGELDGKKEQLLRFALRITPLAAGDIELKGVRVVLALRIKEEQRGVGTFFQSVRMQNYSRVIEAPSHRVIDPPGKTQPAGYRGAVGTTFTYTTSLDRTTATAMSPLTLTMKISGDGVGPQLKPPPLAEIPELSRDFDVSPSVGGGEIQDGTITFTQVIRPRGETVKELPALPLVYYNYAKKDYDTVYSLPVQITVTPGSLVGATAMQTHSQQENSPTASRGDSQSPAAEIISLGANHSVLGELEARPPLGQGGVVAVLLAGPLAILGVWAGRMWQQRRSPLAAVRKQKRELVAALDQIQGDEHFYVGLADLVHSSLRLTFGLPPGEVSATALTQAMDRRDVDGSLRREVNDLLVQCDTGRFAASRVEETEKIRLTEQARRLFAALDRI